MKEKLWEDNQVIGYVDGYVLVEDEIGEWFYFPCEEDLFEIGTVVESELLRPITDLSVEKQHRLRRIWEQMSITK